jgi:hypothetical protein
MRFSTACSVNLHAVRHMREWRCSATHSLLLQWMEVSGRLQILAALPARIELQLLITQEPEWAAKTLVPALH